MAKRKLPPVTGEYRVTPSPRRRTITASTAFNNAWRDALKKAAAEWGEKGREVHVDVDVRYTARIDVWNPGGIGVCGVTLTPR
jgi:hypothetical protein